MTAAIPTEARDAAAAVLAFESGDLSDVREIRDVTSQMLAAAAPLIAAHARAEALLHAAADDPRAASTVDRAAAVLHRHRLTAQGSCSCGHRFTAFYDINRRPEHAAHQAEMLSAAGLFAAAEHATPQPEETP